jgi:hypothetical protein
MKYYCVNCNSEFDPNGWHVLEDKDDVECPFCKVSNVSNLIWAIPTHETVAQWEKRKGRKYPNTALVYACDYGRWGNLSWLMCDQAYPNKYIVATDAGAPPVDWRPE